MSSTIFDLRLLQSSYDRQVGMFRNAPNNARDIAYFKDNIGKVASADDLQKDYRLYSFVMKAFGLDGQIYARALMKKVMSEGVTDPKATANRMQDPRFKELAAVLGFKETGGANLDNPAVVQSIVDRFVTAGFEAQQGEQNPALRLALYFQRKAPGLSNWYQVLADKALSEVVFTTLGLPQQMAMMDIDRLKQQLEKRMSLAEFKDPRKLQSFVTRFAVAYDMKNTDPTTLGLPSLTQPLHQGQGPSIISIDPGVTMALLKFPRF